MSSLRFLAVALLVLAPEPFAWTQSSGTTKERARVTLSTSLPPMDGAHLGATVVEVNYGPGESSPAHRHPCAVIGHVIEGAVRSQVAGEPESTYRTGESFYEKASGVHVISANASQTASARFVAVLICDHEAPISVDVPTTAAKGK